MGTRRQTTPADDSLYEWVTFSRNGAEQHRYRNRETGRFVSAATVRSELDRALDNARRATAATFTPQTAALTSVRDLSLALQRGTISLAEWQVGMMQQVKSAHYMGVALASGGVNNMTAVERGRAGALIREQYDYLRNFAADIASGKQRLDGTFLRRADMYIDAARGSFYRQLEAAAAADNAGFPLMIRSIRHARDSCSDCIALNGKWFRQGDPAYLPVGERQCITSCRCTEEYGIETPQGDIVSLADGRTSEPGAATVTADNVAPVTPVLGGALPSDTFALDVPDAKIRAELEEATQAINSVHGVPPGAVPTIRVIADPYYEGSYYINEATGAGDYISVAPGRTSGIALAHEYGHHLDHEWLRITPNRWRGNPDPDDPYRKEFWKAVRGTRQWAELDKLYLESDSPYVQYITSGREVWARAYSQYVATRSGNPALLRQLAEMRGDPFAFLWDDDDFRPVADAMDALFASRSR